MSEDLVMFEVDEEGHASDIRNVLKYANTTGMDAKEALDATRFTCNMCNRKFNGFSEMILHDITPEAHHWWCRQCYSEECMDDP